MILLQYRILLKRAVTRVGRPKGLSPKESRSMRTIPIVGSRLEKYLGWSPTFLLNVVVPALRET